SEKEGIPGAVSRGVPAEVAEQIFDEMSSFASYAFNKPHAACYAVVALRTGYLKCHYPAEFMAALMNSVSGNTAKIAGYIYYCRQKGIPILPPDINRSMGKFTVAMEKGRKGILFGMGSIKNVGEKAIDSIIRERERAGAFTDIFDFCRRMAGEDVNKRAVESLIKAGCFDHFGAKRVQCMAVFESAMDAQMNQKKQNVTGQVSFFDLGQSGESMRTEETYPPLKEYPLKEILLQEKEVTGIYCSAHPLDEYNETLKKLSFNTTALLDILEGPGGGIGEDGKKVVMGGMVVESHAKATKKGAMMGFMTLEDHAGQIECLLFPKVYERFGRQISEDEAVLVSGRLSIREDEDPKLLVDTIEPLTAVPAAPDTRTDAQRAKDAGEKLYLRMNRSQMGPVQALLSELQGPIPVYINLPEEKITLLCPREMWVRSSEEAMDVLSAFLPQQDMKVVTK
ncbi:MAG: DNA polymerase III subunit alpha, partial [Clostridia bacterium]|nr:DNA polymerase III subunit alpha [Clostridia bacterium]